MPIAKSAAISAQQQPTHQAPCFVPMRAAPDGTIDAQQLARITAKLRPQLDAAEQTARAYTSSPDLHDLATPDIAKRWYNL